MNEAGKSTREMAKKRRQTTNKILIAVLIIGLILTLILAKSKALGLGGLGMLALMIIISALPDIIDRPIDRRIKTERRAGRGARAEEVIGELLENLGEDFFVMHDVDNPNGNIDHIVIKKSGGVFLLETKAHGGRVEIMDDQLLVNGKAPEKDFVRQTLRNTYWLRDEVEAATGIKTRIIPVIVFTNAFVRPGKPVKGITVINKKYLEKFLEQPRGTVQAFEKVWESRGRLRERLME